MASVYISVYGDFFVPLSDSVSVYSRSISLYPSLLHMTAQSFFTGTDRQNPALLHFAVLSVRWFEGIEAYRRRLARPIALMFFFSGLTIRFNVVVLIWLRQS